MIAFFSTFPQTVYVFRKINLTKFFKKSSQNTMWKSRQKYDDDHHFDGKSPFFPKKKSFPFHRNLLMMMKSEMISRIFRDFKNLNIFKTLLCFNLTKKILCTIKYAYLRSWISVQVYQFPKSNKNRVLNKNIGSYFRSIFISQIVKNC